MILPVPVKPYVHHLITKQYGKKNINVRVNSDLGYIFWLAFSDRNVADCLFLPIADVTDEIEIQIPEGMKELTFYLGGKFDKEGINPLMIQRLTYALESYSRIFMKAFSQGYRCLYDSEHSSALVFHKLYEFDEDILTEANAVKIIQRESKEMKKVVQNAHRKRAKIRVMD
jgi:hypothetical protein